MSQHIDGHEQEHAKVVGDICYPNWDAVELKLEHYEYLEERAFFLELALWKWKIEEQLCALTNGNLSPIRLQHRIACGANIFILKGLPFFSGSLGQLIVLHVWDR